MFYAPADSDARSDWGVVCTCREPTQLVVAWAAHYVALGAAEVRIFLDQPQPQLESLLAKIPQVIVTVCTHKYWRQTLNKPRPDIVEYRQLVNAFEAYKDTKLSWLAHFDADEFLHSDVPIEDILLAQPREIDFVVVEPRERAFVEGQPQEGLFDGVFRQPTPQNWGQAPFLFGKAMRFLRQGVLGYPHGKSFTRTGQPMVPGIHTPRRPASHRGLKLRGWAVQRARLLHFDGLTALHWSSKLLRAAATGGHHQFTKKAARDSHRAKQIVHMRKLENSLQQAWNMHQMLKVVPVDQLGRLKTLALIEDYNIDPARDIDALGLGVAIDLSRAAFDEALTRNTEDFARWLPEWERLTHAADSAGSAQDKRSIGKKAAKASR